MRPCNATVLLYTALNILILMQWWLMALTNDEWYFLNSSKIWLRGIVHQGQRLLENQQRMQSAMQAITGENLIWRQDFHVYNDLRIVEEHFFVISVSKAIDWLKEARKFRKDLITDIDIFLQGLPEAKDVRNMREHDIDYFKGKGKAQDRFIKNLPEATIDGSASYSDSNGYVIGGRLNVQHAIDAAQRLYPKVEKVVLEIHEIE